MHPLLLGLVFIAGCYRQSQPMEVVDKDKVSVSVQRINYAYKVCKANGAIKEIQVKPRALIICGNGAVFRR